MLSSTLILATLLQIQDTKKVDILKVGDLAPEFVVDKWNGGQMKLSDRKDKVAVVTFWNSTTPQSSLVMNHLQELTTKIRASQLVSFMYINSGDDTATYADWMTKNAGKYTGTWGYDSMGQSQTNSLAWKTYGATTLPTTFVVDTTGRVHAIINGYNTGDTRFTTALKSAGIQID